MKKDRYDLPVTTSSDVAMAAFDGYVEGQLSYSLQITDIFKAVEEDPLSPLYNAHAALVHMSLEAQEGFASAKPFVAQALAQASAGTPREQDYVAAADAWYRGDAHQSLRIFDKIVAENPNDISAAKWGQYHAFNIGDAGQMLRLSDAILPLHKTTPYAYGMRAFALEQSHRLEEAEDFGREAVSMVREERWAHHAVAHVMETQGRLDEGVAWLEDLAPTWDEGTVFIREHNWWHLALFELDRENEGRVLDIYDERLWGEWPELGQEQVGAISALWRMELRGLDIGARWVPVAEQVSKRTFEHIQPFLDMHYLFALGRAGLDDLANDFLKSMAQHASGCAGELKPIWSGVALPLAHGILAYTKGDYARALLFWEKPIGELMKIGGSHAQRDLFVQSWIDALIKEKRYDEADRALHVRLKARPNVRCTEKLLNETARLRKTI